MCSAAVKILNIVQYERLLGLKSVWYRSCFHYLASFVPIVLNWGHNLMNSMRSSDYYMVISYSKVPNRHWNSDGSWYNKIKYQDEAKWTDSMVTTRLTRIWNDMGRHPREKIFSLSYLLLMMNNRPRWARDLHGVRKSGVYGHRND